MAADTGRQSYDAKTAYQRYESAERYEKREFYQGFLGRYRKRAEQAAIGGLTAFVPQGSEFLDCPCGNGRWFETLARRARKITGVDVSEGMLRFARDRAESLPVMVVNEPFVERILGMDDPLGHSVELFFPPWVPTTQWTVVGVVPPTIQAGPHEPEEIIIYVPVEQIHLYWTADQIGYTRNVTFLAPFQQGARADVVFQGLREAVWAGEPTLPIVRLARLEDVQAEMVAQPRFFAVLMGAFASVALLLAALAVLASVAQYVRHRTREFGLRKALGADARDVVGKTLVDGALLALIGVTIGAVLSWFAARLLAAQVVGVQGWSPAIQGGVALVLVLTAVLASLAPALRASRIDPMEALRHE